MNKLTAVAIDDEPMALNVILHHASEVSFLDLQATFTDVKDAVAYLAVNSVDVLFADIQMPGMTGIDLARLYGSNTQVVFTTAYPDYAVQGFEVNAADYLLKPISLLRFLQACQKVQQKIKLPPLTEVFLKDGGEWIRINPASVKYAEAQGNYIKLVTTSTNILLRMSFSVLADKLPGNYLRVHKSFVVNPDYIERIETHQLTIGIDRIPIGAAYREQMLGLLGLKNREG